MASENVADFAAERDLVLLFVLKRNLPAGGAQAPALAKLLDLWAGRLRFHARQIGTSGCS